MTHLLRSLGLGPALLVALGLSTVTAASYTVAPMGPGRSGPVAACRTSQLTVAPDRLPNGVINGDAGVSNLALMYRIHNHSPQSCTLYGYPGIQLLDANRRPLLTRLTWSRSAYLFLSPPARLVRLNPGGDAFFALGWNHAASAPANRPCPSAPYMLVTPPNERTSLLLRDGPDSCDGRLIASPVQPARFRI